ncbi:M13 family metallopeptidase [Maricaulis sp.]|uniref:M13 family metallopeptidase n=1 Tax=Maricaulis sp. TaxID=1486257 RepID=UPI002612815F|nr:M13 family metallopeptidase [Maricaulis sp.]
MRKFLLAGASLALLAACTPATEAPAPQEVAQVSVGDPSAGQPRLGNWGIETQHIDNSVHPGDDFNRYVNAGWLDGSELPQGFSRFGAFTELFLLSEERIDAIIAEAASADAEAGTPLQQIGDLHASFLDRETLTARGFDPVRPMLDTIAGASSHDDIADLMGRPGTSSIFGAGVTRDQGNPDRYIVGVSQSGLGLPTRDYYLEDSERYQGYRDAYVEYIADVFGFIDMDGGAERAQRILDLETMIAQVHWTRQDSRDRTRTYNLMTTEELAEYAPGFNWTTFMEALDFADQTEVVIRQNTAIQSLATMFTEVPVETWQDWMTFRYVSSNRNLLTPEFFDRSFAFYSTTLSGVAEPRPLEARAIQFVNGNAGMALGQIYVERHFPPEYKQQMEVLVDYLGRALRERLETLDWMDDETREGALYKFENFTPKIGYPDQWPDYSSVEIRADDLFGNSERMAAWFRADSRARLRGPIREWEWGMTPQTVNAYYSPTANEIVFPAAILQGPFFDPYADPAVNFGGIGSVIGHEMGHGFDDQGSRSDGDGVLRDWWTESSRANFDALTDRLAAQYSEFSPIEGEFVNGRLSLGENIGDVGGLSMAFRAYQLYLEDHGGEAPVLDGYTGNQRFYMAWAQVWRNLYTEEAMVQQLRRGPHSPPQYRINGALRNQDGWYEAFGITEEHDLYLPPEERVSIW